MLAINYLIIITDRADEERYIEFLRAHGVERVHSSLSHGTANEKLLDYFNVEKIEKVTLEAFVRDSQKDELVRDMKEGRYGKMPYRPSFSPDLQHDPHGMLHIWAFIFGLCLLLGN